VKVKLKDQKFNIGDTVYLLNHGTIYKAIVLGASIERDYVYGVKEDKPRDVEFEYALYYDGSLTNRWPQKLTFGSLEELLSVLKGTIKEPGMAVER
jgi:hypothetical protein